MEGPISVAQRLVMGRMWGGRVMEETAPVTGSEEELVAGGVCAGSRGPWDQGQSCSGKRPQGHDLVFCLERALEGLGRSVNGEQIELEHPWQGSNWGVARAEGGSCFALLAGGWGPEP